MKIRLFLAILLSLTLVTATVEAVEDRSSTNMYVGKVYYRDLLNEQFTDRMGNEYVIESYLGRGSYVHVYKIRNLKTNENYAFRIFNDDALTSPNLPTIRENNDYLKALPIEGILKIISHGSIRFKRLNILKSYSTITELAISTAEQYEGFKISESKTEEEFLSRLRKLERLMLQGLSAIENLKTNDLVHNDIKPSNILVLKDGSTRLGDNDFLSPVSKSSTKDFASTLSYVAPELLAHGSIPSYKSDLFSFGLSMAEVVVGNKLPLLYAKRYRLTENALLLNFGLKRDWDNIRNFIDAELQNVIDTHRDIRVRQRLTGLKEDILLLISTDPSDREAVKESYLSKNIPVRKSCLSLF